MYDDGPVAVLLSLDECSSWLGELLDTEDHAGTPEEQDYAAHLREADDDADRERHHEAGASLDLAPLVGDLRGRVSPLDLVVLAAPASADESSAHKVARLQGLDRVAALVASVRHDVLVDLAGEDSSEQLLAEMHVEHEVAVARRTSRYSAGRSIENPRALATVFVGFADALRAEEVSEAHVSMLVERTRVVSDPAALVEIGRRALPKARRMTPGELGKELAAIIADVDPDAAARTRRARESRRVWTRPLDDGMSFLGLVHDASTIDAIKAGITADAQGMKVQHRTAAQDASAPAECASDDHEWEQESLDALRADAMAARLLGRPDGEGGTTWDRSEATVVVNVVMDVDTLKAERATLEIEPVAALVDGEPVPAALARDLADAATWWRRLVTDPVDGHLLDYGAATYLPSRLRRFVLARDDVCRGPGCTHRGPRLQMDHAAPFPEGASSAENCGALSTPCHALKTAGYADILDSRADGSATWVTAWGQHVPLPPRPVLPGHPDPDPPPQPPPPPPEPHDSPPF